jgi:hypothetical protein
MYFGDKLLSGVYESPTHVICKQTYKTDERGPLLPQYSPEIFQLLLAHGSARSQSSPNNFIDAKMIRSANYFSSTSVVALFP